MDQKKHQSSNKPKVIKSYENLSQEVLEAIKLHYPNGFKKNLISFIDREGKFKKALPFETNEFYYLVKMTEAKAAKIIDDDDDYDEDGILKDKSRKKFEDNEEIEEVKHEDLPSDDDFNLDD